MQRARTLLGSHATTMISGAAVEPTLLTSTSTTSTTSSSAQILQSSASPSNVLQLLSIIENGNDQSTIEQNNNKSNNNNNSDNNRGNKTTSARAVDAAMARRDDTTSTDGGRLGALVFQLFDALANFVDKSLLVPTLRRASSSVARADLRKTWPVAHAIAGYLHALQGAQQLAVLLRRHYHSDVEACLPPAARRRLELRRRLAALEASLEGELSAGLALLLTKFVHRVERILAGWSKSEFKLRDDDDLASLTNEATQPCIDVIALCRVVRFFACRLSCLKFNKFIFTKKIINK